MKRKMKQFISLLVCITFLLIPLGVFARSGECGYEGGISSGGAPGKTEYEYQEMCFITGEPLIFKGTLKIKKSLKQDTISSTYTYSLKNADKAATLTRVLSYTTKLVDKGNGQVVEETVLSKQPSEVVRIGNASYVLRNYDFTRSSLVDKKPAINYYAGNTWGRKTYQTGTAATGGTVTVEATGKFYGYDQYWSTAETEIIDFTIESEQKRDGEIDVWIGTAKVSLSATMMKQLKYFENRPDQISFDGGYVETQYNDSILEYSCKLPEFDSKGVSTDIIKTTSDSLKLETFPETKRLPTPDIRHLNGHWAENEIRTLYSLEIFKDKSTLFNPQKYITRAEFVSAIVEAAKEVPVDESLVKKTSRTSASKKKSKEVIASPFSDVPIDSIYFEPIDKALKRGIIAGNGDKFLPNGTISLADAITIFINALGLQGMSPGTDPVTTFKDNDLIPRYAREAVYVAEKIGIINGDTMGYLRPEESLTKARVAALLNNFISYMRDGIKKDYRERIVNYK